MKSKSTAYLLWLLLGFAGAHKFYLEKTTLGVLYLFTLGFFGIGWIIDIFSLGSQVDAYNALLLGKNRNVNTNINNVVVNVPSHAPATAPTHSSAPSASIKERLSELAELKEQGIITQEEFDEQKKKVLA